MAKKTTKIKLDEQILLNVSKATKSRWAQAAVLAGVGLNEFIRRVMDERCPPSIQPTPYS